MITTTSNIKIVGDLAQVIDSKFFKTLSEPVRVDILKFLMINGKADIATIAGHMPQDRSVISRHLNLMHEVGILTCTKESRHMIYEIDGYAFLEKLENITELVRKSIPLCCPR